MKKFKRILSVMLALLLTVSITYVFGYKDVNAAITPDKPRIGLKLTSDGAGVTITIRETNFAYGYAVYMKGPKDKKFKEIGKVNQSGYEVRTYVAKDLAAGKYSFKVKAYYEENGKKTWGKFSSVSKIKVKGASKSKTGSTSLAKAKKGDVVIFGSYEQDNNTSNGKEKLEWVVLSNDGSKALLVTKYVIDYMSYTPGFEEATWDYSSIRDWLNSDFYKAAFSKDEKSKIKSTTVKNFGVDGAYGGENTKDKVFLLSYDDATNTKYGFSDTAKEDDINRRVSPTDYAKDKGAYTESYKDTVTSDRKEATRWMLRTTSNYSSYEVCYVMANGKVYTDLTSYNECGIRPAIYVSVK